MVLRKITYVLMTTAVLSFSANSYNVDENHFDQVNNFESAVNIIDETQYEETEYVFEMDTYIQPIFTLLAYGGASRTWESWENTDDLHFFQSNDLVDQIYYPEIWSDIFVSLWSYENNPEKILSIEFSDTTSYLDYLSNNYAYDIENTFYVIPEHIFESVITDYFDVSIDYLQKINIYNVEINSYIVLDMKDRIYPTLVPEISRIQEASDNVLAIDLDYRQLGNSLAVFGGTLYIRLKSDGTFVYEGFTREYTGPPYLAQ